MIENTPPKNPATVIKDAEPTSKRPPNDLGRIDVGGHIRIFDPQTKKTIVEKFE